ncbi:sigma-54-dependent Fis family transcriptional regulator [Limnohabitans sp. Rim28]|uniref:sigma-54 interaction domain-containing protein n=1 Tax=Limnohabitans sp. Rim28 TaxID=1100720 RepID=UPI00030A55D7|nr:sigma-54 dependent transcriptional regulator [Limnohabitans sp. Rim28]PVE05505.1 sigma-54-dependent Fis family transcriptional regulator [Limnohabitans sp. Rim28]
MKSTAPSAPLALWLDPEAALSTEQSNALQVSGWAMMSVNTLDHLLAHAADAAMVVLHLTLDVTRLKAVQQLLLDAGLCLPVVCRVDRHEFDLAVEATQAGALTVLAADEVRPDSWQRVHALLKTGSSRSAQVPVRQVVFVDPSSQHLLALARKVAQADVTALLVGPTGSGKEVLARVLHEASGRALGPFVALNCAAMPENLIEDMLFGHEKGAFTGAHREQKGLFEQAQGGTLFLDEIGEMPMHLQSKLLRVLQERQLTRLGGQSVIQLNVRIVAATNKDLKQAIAEREFREDLYYRIATFRMRLLPLRERPGDIIPLAMQSLMQQAAQPWRLHPQAQQMLLQYPWPGNVRELENVMRRAVVLCTDHHITPAHLMFDDWLTHHMAAPKEQASLDAPDFEAGAPAWPLAVPVTVQATPESMASPVTPAPAPAEPPVDLQSAVRLNEHQVIMATLASTPSKTEAAKRLGISPRTLRYKMAQLREHGMNMAAAC